MSAATVLFWDIDGTLLTTGRAGIFAWEDALRDEVGGSSALESLRTAGLTDIEIAVQLLKASGRKPSSDNVLRLLRAYERYLPSSLPKRVGQVLPNVRAILEQLQGLPDVCSLLLTGNTRAGASAKLSHYGLQAFFVDGAFSDDTTDRPSIARKAMMLARSRVGEVGPDRVYVIGDTPHDIQSGRAIGARVIAVATGGYSVEELGPLNPWWLLQELPSPDQFLDRLGLVVAR
jgi:phosphoglycolate phosphatase-like HAD superfamily hydrolase